MKRRSFIVSVITASFLTSISLLSGCAIISNPKRKRRKRKLRKIRRRRITRRARA